jgi:ankyrin repeat protein
MEFKMDIIDFYRAVAEGDIKKVKKFNFKNISLNENITYACGSNWVITLPLITAFENGHLEVAKYLISKGANLDAFCRKRKKTVREFMPKDFEI